MSGKSVWKYQVQAYDEDGTLISVRNVGNLESAEWAASIMRKDGYRVTIHPAEGNGTANPEQVEASK